MKIVEIILTETEHISGWTRVYQNIACYDT